MNLFIMKKKKENLYDLLDKMRERPALYTGEHSLSAIYHFIQGYFAAHNFETNESPNFGKFHDYVGTFYGKYSTAGWKNLILADHFGNEAEAIIRFYELLDDFKKGVKYNSRAIVLKLLNACNAEVDGNKEHLNEIKPIAQIINSQLPSAIYGGIIVWYDAILKDIFARVNGNDFMTNWVQQHAPEILDYQYEIWSGSDGKVIATSCFSSNNTQKDVVKDDFQIFIKRFYAFDFEHDALPVKEAFLDELSTPEELKKK